MINLVQRVSNHIQNEIFTLINKRNSFYRSFSEITLLNKINFYEKNEK